LPRASAIRGISLGAMIPAAAPGPTSSLVFLTHPAREENARAAVDEIGNGSDFCHGQPRVFCACSPRERERRTCSER